jgi:hypothetical protein
VKTAHKATAENNSKPTQHAVEISTETNSSTQQQPSTTCEEVENGNFSHKSKFFIPRK